MKQERNALRKDSENGAERCLQPEIMNEGVAKRSRSRRGGGSCGGKGVPSRGRRGARISWCHRQVLGDPPTGRLWAWRLPATRAEQSPPLAKKGLTCLSFSLWVQGQAVSLSSG